MKNIKLLGLGSILSVASIGATLPFVVACGSDEKDNSQLLKLNNLLINKTNTAKKLEIKLKDLEAKVTKVGKYLDQSANANKDMFNSLVAKYKEIKNIANEKIPKDKDNNEIKIESLSNETLVLDKNFATNYQKILKALFSYKTKLEVAIEGLHSKINSLNSQISSLNTMITSLKKEIEDGKTNVDKLNDEMDKFIDKMKNIFDK